MVSRLRTLPFILIAAGIPLLSLLPVALLSDWVGGAPAFPHADKLVHACMYGLLTGAALFAFPGLRGWRGALPVFLGVTLYGAAMELGQKWLASGRSADIWDGVANALGALAVILLSGCFRKGKIRRGAGRGKEEV